MPFNINLEKTFNEVSLKLQVDRNVITCYFYGIDSAAEEVLKSWVKVEENFPHDFFKTYATYWMRGSDAPHLKRNHSNIAELDTIHHHFESKYEITPSILKLYFKNFIVQQQNILNFRFINTDELEIILAKFKIYFSNLQSYPELKAFYNAERALTLNEKLQYTKDCIEDIQIQNDIDYEMSGFHEFLLANRFFKSHSGPVTLPLEDEGVPLLLALK